MENFAKDFEYVCQKIGVSYDSLPYRHKTAHRHYSTYYNERTRKIIARKYKADIKAFGYAFEDKRDGSLKLFQER